MRRVRVTIEGPVVPGSRPIDGPWLPGHTLTIVEGDDVTVEHLPEPEPDWQRGDLVRLAGRHYNVTWLRTTKGWAGQFGETFPPEHLDGCEVVLLVRNGAAV